jgi:hypothetical protein
MVMGHSDRPIRASSFLGRDPELGSRGYRIVAERKVKRGYDVPIRILSDDISITIILAGYPIDLQ